MMKLLRQFLFLLVSYSTSDASVRIINVVGSNPVNNEVGRDIHLKWDITGMREDCAKTFTVILDNPAKHHNKIISAGTNDKKQETIYFEQRKSSKVAFTEHMSGECDINIPYGVCSFKISRADYTANGVIILQYLCISDRAEMATGNVTINTEGGPDLCGDYKLTQNITCVSGRSIRERVTLCGKPEPKLYWMIGNEKMNATIDRSRSNVHQYTYEIIFPAAGNCGKKLKYVAIGYKGLNRTEESQILPEAQNYVGDGGSGLDIYATAGIIVASIFLLALLIMIICCRCLRNKKQGNHSSHKENSIWGEDTNLASAPLASENA